MSRHTAIVEWKRGENERFVDQKYSRAHLWRFDGGARVAASASPHIVPLPHSVAENVDPEEAFIAALSSCHMLFFLSFAARKGYVVDSYVDEAQGVMERNEEGRLAMTSVKLRPRITYQGTRPERSVEEELHHQAHEACFLANSVKTKVETQLPEE
ncbi:MAG TPA: OsmC family protein [Steroidobacteraceae bacterium]|jgi:organic hydroperoxide reductase OsmC/OhrA